MDKNRLLNFIEAVVLIFVSAGYISVTQADIIVQGILLTGVCAIAVLSLYYPEVLRKLQEEYNEVLPMLEAIQEQLDKQKSEEEK